MDITYQYTKKRCDFGRQPLFCEQGPDMCDSIATDVTEHKRYILRNPVHQLTQNTPEYSEHYINTRRAKYTQSGANHSEGGWPKDVNILDPEATQRYRRKIEKDDGYIHCIMALTDGMEHYVYQNNAIDMYQSYYKEMKEQPEVERIGMRTVNVYRDKNQRPVSSISWQAESSYHFAVSYVDFSDFFRTPRNTTDASLWDIENANSPEAILNSHTTVLDLQYSPRDPNLLIGGFLTGQVGSWDKRKAGAPDNVSAPHVAHRDYVRQVRFINTKSGVEFFSSGPDGVCKWWDLRHLDEPTDEMIMDFVTSSFDSQSMVTANGVSTLEYEPTIPTRFMVGCENGKVIGGNRKGKTPMEKLPFKIDAHEGPVWSLERNPGFLKNFLTVGDWTVRVWSEECRESAILWSPPLRYSFSAGNWSPTRLSLMLMCGMDGRISAWDLLRRQSEPILTMQLPEPLLRQEFHDQGSIVAVGGRKGNIFMVELAHRLAQSQKNDKGLLTAIFERESKRERILEARLREIRLKMRQAEEGSPKASATDIDPTMNDRDLAEATADYQSQVKKELAAM